MQWNNSDKMSQIVADCNNNKHIYNAPVASITDPEAHIDNGAMMLYVGYLGVHRLWLQWFPEQHLSSNCIIQ